MSETDLLVLINKCMLMKLNHQVDESESHIEYDLRRNKLEIHIQLLKKHLELNAQIFESSLHVNDILVALILLYLELKTSGEWNFGKCNEYAYEINEIFLSITKVSLGNLLCSVNKYNVQCIYDLCLEKLHSKLTINDFKYYPSLIEVYVLFIQDLKNYKVKVSPVKVLPVSLLLIDDYMNDYNLKGLNCCEEIFKCLGPKDFENGNFYEVIYQNLCVLLKKKNQNIGALLNCLLEFIRILPSKDKDKITCKLFSEILEETLIESEFQKKTAILVFLSEFISIHKVNCVKSKHKFNELMCDCLDLCSNEIIKDVMLKDLIKCLETWLVHCWCAWNYDSDKKLLSNLFKLLYILSRKDEDASQLKDIVVTMINLCKEEEKKQIVISLQSFNLNKCDKFVETLENICKQCL